MQFTLLALSRRVHMTTHNVPLYKCYLDLTKVYDLVHRETLWQILEIHGVPPLLLRLIRNLFDGAEATIKVDGTLIFPTIPLVSGIKQGSVLSPLLYNIYSGVLIAAMRREYAASNIPCGINLVSKPTQYFRLEKDKNTPWTHFTLHEMLYVDDVVLFAESEEALQRMAGIHLAWNLYHLRSTRQCRKIQGTRSPTTTRGRPRTAAHHLRGSRQAGGR